ncbi:muscle M-line assembly protein unc-89-like isoform X2 [Penaeus monodon]|uniref:muscle M-line assembly protein unc-89-like isoform X2 n=1 Tax=Penaeus monodon TaxID=6687 RepID=UPI0018A73845|nr:muscle M-line assembly protein unc-89-like isoform X2 [Penaeus monodon]
MESAVDVVEEAAGAAAKAAHDTPGIPESVAEKAEETKEIAEKVEEVIGTVEFVAEKVEEIAEEIKKEAEAIESKAVELIESKEKREELIEKAIDYVTGQTPEELKSTDVKDLEVTPIEEEVKQIEDVKAKEEAPAAEVKEAEVVADKSIEKIGLVGKLMQFFSNEEKTPESVEPVVKDAIVEGGEIVEEKAAEAVSEVAQSVEKDAGDVSKVAQVVEDVSTKVESVVEVVEEAADAAVTAAHDTPGIPESVAEKAEETKSIVEKVEEVIGTVEIVAEKVEEIAEEIKKEAEAIESRAVELIESKEKREELIEKAIDYVTGQTPEELKSTDVKDLEVTPVEEEVKQIEDVKAKEEAPAAEVKEAEADKSIEKIGLVGKLMQFFSSEEEKPGKDVAVEGESAVQKAADEVITAAGVVEEISKKVESAVDVVEEAAGAAVTAAHDTPGIPESVAEKAEETKEVAEKVEEVIGTVESVAEKVEEVAEETKKEAEIIEGKADTSQAESGLFDQLISIFSKKEETKEDVPPAPEAAVEPQEPDTVVATERAEKSDSEGAKDNSTDIVNIDETVSTSLKPSETNDDSTPVVDKLLSSESAKKESLVEKFASFFGEKKPDSKQSAGVTSDSSKEIHASDSPTEAVPEPVAVGDSSPEGATSVSGPSEESQTGAEVKQEGKDVIVQLTPTPVEKDYGQSNPEDADMYTTRS